MINRTEQFARRYPNVIDLIEREIRIQQLEHALVAQIRFRAPKGFVLSLTEKILTLKTDLRIETLSHFCGGVNRRKVCYFGFLNGNVPDVYPGNFYTKMLEHHLTHIN